MHMIVSKSSFLYFQQKLAMKIQIWPKNNQENSIFRHSGEVKWRHHNFSFKFLHFHRSIFCKILKTQNFYKKSTFSMKNHTQTQENCLKLTFLGTTRLLRPPAEKKMATNKNQDNHVHNILRILGKNSNFQKNSQRLNSFFFKRELKTSLNSNCSREPGYEAAGNVFIWQFSSLTQDPKS